MISILIPTIKNDINLLLDEIKRTATDVYEIIVSSNAEFSASQNRNACLNKAKGNYIVMIDDDVTGFFPGWNEALVKSLNESGAVFVSARLIRKDGVTPNIMCDSKARTPEDLLKERYEELPHLPTACCVFKNSILRFDENFIGSGWEDTLFCKALDGKCLIDNTIRVVHLNEMKNQKENWDWNQLYCRWKEANPDIKFVAFYKVLTGEEWFEASLNSIKSCVDAIVVVFGQNMWGKEELYDYSRCEFILMEWAKNNTDVPVHFTYIKTNDQNDQYNHGLNWIKSLYPKSYMLFIDTDEVWEKHDLLNLKKHAIQNPNFLAFSCQMRTYIKSPFYRIEPPEPCHPIVLVNTAKVDKITGARGNTLTKTYLPDVWMHHFSFVRSSLDKIKEKLYYSAFGDHIPSHEDWIERVWNNIPNVTNFHHSKGYEKCWQHIISVDFKDLPKAVTNFWKRDWNLPASKVFFSANWWSGYSCGK